MRLHPEPIDVHNPPRGNEGTVRTLRLEQLVTCPHVLAPREFFSLLKCECSSMCILSVHHPPPAVCPPRDVQVAGSSVSFEMFQMRGRGIDGAACRLLEHRRSREHPFIRSPLSVVGGLLQGRRRHRVTHVSPNSPRSPPPTPERKHSTVITHGE
ncbi:unnamed protein product [Pleuronectes platessa]|uniref:Uncharacterized protein n=1 Tax=Pleuronectes platessa TaxID=8262 RepID=A0A9N7VGR4_PLEPL|nr:unnamed protein product [Pleuronectes platessa]